MSFPGVVAPNPAGEDTVAPISRDGELVLSGRIRTVEDAASLYQQMRQADYIGNYNRSLVDSALDGGCPKQGYQAAVGGNRETNINWGDGEQLLHAVCSPDFDLIFSPEIIGSTPLKRSYADEGTRADYEEVIAEEVSNMVREWPLYITTKQREILERKKHGVATVYWLDENNWKWNMAGLEMFKMPRPTEIGVENLPYCGLRSDMLPEHLYQMIRDEKIAAEAGWNVAEVKRTLMRAAPINPIYDDFEAWERYWKDNDYMMSYDKAVCPLVLMPVKELDGSVTLLLFNWDGSGDFLYKKSNAFGGIERFCQIYTDNVGTNKYYHAIRGFGSKIYAALQTVNRMTNTVADAVYTSSMLIFTPPSESDADEAAYMQSGSYLVLNPGWIQSQVKLPDLQNSVMPGLSLFTDRLQRSAQKVGSGNAAAYGDGKTPKHMFNAQLEQMAMTADADLENYLATWERHYREVVRRIIRKDYLPKEPGGLEVANLRLRLKERGIPTDALENVDWKRVRINRGIGAGSAASRILAYDRLQGMRGAMSPDKQQLFDRDTTIAVGGVQMADRYFPKPKDRRLPTDASFADATNPEIMRGEQIPIRDGQNQVVIAQIRMEKLKELLGPAVQGGKRALLQVVVPMHYLLQDMQGRLEKANPQDPAVQEMEKQSGQFNELVTNGLRELQAVQEKQQKEMAHNAGKIGDQQVQGAPGGDVPHGTNGALAEHTGKLIEQSIKLKAQIEFAQQKSHQYALDAAQKRAIEAQKAAQDMQLRDIQAAADVRRLGLS